MRLMSIASGSSGNVTYVGSDNTHILIDSGVSRKRITEGLKALDLSLNDLDAILITHEHTDHIASLAVIERTREIPVYTTAGTAQALISKGCIAGKAGLIHKISSDNPFMIGDISITALRTSHDAAEPVCYRLSCRESSCAVVTDLGCYNDYLTDNLRDLTLLMAEANHDIKMLETGPYPYPLKRRIAGPSGHLSNETSGNLISEVLNDRMKYIVLGHLSQKNNYSELARLAVENEIDQSDNSYKSSDFRIDVAGQTTGTDIFNF